MVCGKELYFHTRKTKLCILKEKCKLEEHMLPHLQEKIARVSILQQDNDPKHTSLLARTLISEHDVHVLSQSILTS